MSIDPKLITHDAFWAYLQCETKWFLQDSGASGSQTGFSDWERHLANEYERRCRLYLRSGVPDSQCLADIDTDFLKSLADSECRLLLNCDLQSPQGISSRIHALERLTSLAKTELKNHWIPFRFAWREKVTLIDKLLLTFDALVLAASLGEKEIPRYGKIIHGSGLVTHTVQLPNLTERVLKIVKRIEELRAANTPPQLLLNSHCSECPFQAPCRQKVMEQDDLILLGGMTPKERKKYNDKGIFTVTQLAYTFRARRRPKRFVAKPQKYNPALRALAIREKKIHIVGRPAWKVEGNAVYLDVEGLPDQEFYYLIGIRFRKGDAFVQLSFWANDPTEEKAMWMAFVQALADIDNPQLLHYGSYETTFLEKMMQRYAGLPGLPGINSLQVDTKALKGIIAQAVNVLSLIYARIYFPTYTNSLKEIAQYLGYHWSEETASGLKSLLWRSQWENSKEPLVKAQLVQYNADDCEALEITATTLAHLCPQADEVSQSATASPASPTGSPVVYTDQIKGQFPFVWGKVDFVTPEMEYINQCAYWDYQREKILIRSSPRLKEVQRHNQIKDARPLPSNKVIPFHDGRPDQCPECGTSPIYRYGKFRKTVYDLKFGTTGVKRWIVTYQFDRYRCKQCGATFFASDRPWTRSAIGHNLLSYIVYQLIDLQIAQRAIVRHVNELFGYRLNLGTISHQKQRASQIYQSTYEAILGKLVSGKLIHADETPVSISGKDGYVWVLTSLEEVYYFYKDTREGDTIQQLLKKFNGVLVSDFYSVYDSFSCAQQKCLIHLMRDLNDDYRHHPFNLEMKQIVDDFSALLQPIIKTVDQFGLKSRHLKKHNAAAARFFGDLAARELKTEVARGYQQRFLRNREKLFTFLSWDGIPWNNNNAEHAIKAFAVLRRSIQTMSTEKGIREYLTLLSIRQTCRYKGITFLDFLRSEEKSIDQYLENMPRTRRVR